jgi:2-oxoglutarate ferredoxin oxidoreductase subunit beta
MSFDGTAVLDIISPCVTFNNHDESTKSYAWGKEYEDPLHDVTYVPKFEEIRVEMEPGEAKTVVLHDGSMLVLKKLDQDYDPTNRVEALKLLEETNSGQVLVTGLIYFNPDLPSLQDSESMVETPLSALQAEELRPNRASLESLMADFR